MTEKVMIQIGDKVIEAKEDKLAYIEAWKADLDKAAAEQAAQEAAKKASKQSAIEKLTALGLTEQEVFDLLGITPEPEKE
jgi:hypothetical protein